MDEYVIEWKDFRTQRWVRWDRGGPFVSKEAAETFLKSQVKTLRTLQPKTQTYRIVFLKVEWMGEL